MSKYSRIVFLQGDDADEFFAIPSHKREERLEFLKQWDNGEDDDIHDESAAGLYDESFYSEEYPIGNGMGAWQYLMTYNIYHHYASLERIFYNWQVVDFADEL